MLPRYSLLIMQCFDEFLHRPFQLLLDNRQESAGCDGPVCMDWNDDVTFLRMMKNMMTTAHADKLISKRPQEFHHFFTRHTRQFRQTHSGELIHTLSLERGWTGMPPPPLLQCINQLPFSDHVALLPLSFPRHMQAHPECRQSKQPILHQVRKRQLQIQSWIQCTIFLLSELRTIAWQWCQQVLHALHIFCPQIS